jgi:pimeloyl-ACP methyl ester carboxylesterase
VKTLLVLGLIALAIYIALCAGMYWSQDRLLYFPTPEIDRPGVQALRIKRGDVTIKVWALHPSAQPALLYFGGNGEDVGANLHDFAGAFPDRAIYLVNYRGYGGSTGHPSEAALIADGEAIYDQLVAQHDHIIVMGRSLGTGVATALATERSARESPAGAAARPVAGLVLVTPYDSIANVGAGRYPWLPVRWLIKDPYDSAARIGKVKAPVLVLVAEKDDSILRPRSDALIAAAPAGLTHVVVIPSAGHNDIETFPAYWRALKAFSEQ